MTRPTRALSIPDLWPSQSRPSREAVTCVAIGRSALLSNGTGSNNVATGQNAMASNTTGSANVAIGTNAGRNLTTGSRNIDVANLGKVGEAGTIRIGTAGKQTATFIAGISGTPLGGAAEPVVIKSNGQLGTAPGRSVSAARFIRTVRRLEAEIERLREQVKGGWLRWLDTPAAGRADLRTCGDHALELVEAVLPAVAV
jgi:hypothetical protein